MGELPRRSELDSRRFGIEVYRVRLDDEASARRALAFRNEVPIDLMIARTATRNYSVGHILAADGFYLCDTLVYFEGQTSDLPEPTRRFSVRQAGRPDEAPLADLARNAFADFGGHYHQDPRLDGRRATEGYVEWCLASLGDSEGFVLVAEEKGALAGFITVRRVDPDRAEILLNGVARAFQRRGVYAELVRATGAHLRSCGTSNVSVSTQISNLAPQRVWVRCGLLPTGSEYTFHKWYDGRRDAGPLQ